MGGKQAEVRGTSAPPMNDLDGAWHYSVAVEEGGMVMFAEEHLEATGRSAPSGAEPGTWISVSVDGRITGGHTSED